MNNRQALKRYMALKHDIIKSTTGMNLYSILDYDDTDDWLDSDVDEVLRILVENLSLYKLGLYVGDKDGCPQCIKTLIVDERDNCDQCGYGEKHGICWQPNSHYNEIYRARDKRLMTLLSEHIDAKKMLDDLIEEIKEGLE